MNSSQVKEFILDGRNIHNMDEFFDEVQRVFCPTFKSFGRNWSAFQDVLRGGFGTFEVGERIRVRFIHQKSAKKYLPESQFKKILKILKDSENVELST